MKKLLLLICWAIAAAPPCFSQQDTLRVCTYNLLNYGNPGNAFGYKNQRLQPILQEIRPSLACFNEIASGTPGMLDTLLGVMPFASAHGAVHNTNNTNQLDGLFWRLGKFRLLDDSIICNNVRDIVAYNLYYDDPALSIYHDTIRLTVITAHLKSSNSAADRAARDLETQKVTAYLSGLGRSLNVIMMGDLNLYFSNEAAYQNLTNTPDTNARLYDPLSRPGSWDNNSAFAGIHTQSTRLLALPDGGASGGLDSRFDFILVSRPILTGSQGILYRDGSYTSFGNDGLHYGRALIDTPANMVVSAGIAQALYECSDHLPVYADFIFIPSHPPVVTGVGYIPLQEAVKVVNPLGTAIQLLGTVARLREYQLISADGRLMQLGYVNTNGRIDLSSGLSAGIYILKLKDSDGELAYFRLIQY